MAKLKSLRYIVTGPGIADGEEPSYADPGPAFSRSLTAAECTRVEGSWYVRDAVTDKVLGYSEVTRDSGVLITQVVRHK